ncbi:MAG: PorV/PorQ family protein [candidate division Zixibacteria bacterium]|nr:PorV/PorQ family protein [candidate division Zixibacteria bacterium]
MTFRFGLLHSGKAIVLATALFCFLLASIASAGTINKNAGTTGFSFLKLGKGARAVAMGGAYTALIDDASTINYNPSGTAHLSGKKFLAGYHNYVLDVQSGFLVATMPVKNYGHGSVFIEYMNYGDFARTDNYGVVDINDPSFSGGDFLFGLNFARQFNPLLSAGMNVKFISEFADGYSSQALAVDLGLLLSLPDSLTRVGLSVFNLGGVLSGFSANSDNPHKDKLPRWIRAGVAHSLRELPLLIALDAVLPNDNDPYFSVGIEFYKLQPLYLRLGYSTFGQNYKTGSDSDGLGGTSFGFGLDWKNYQFSYAFMPYLDLGSSHRVTVTGGF